jgi:formylglycine-generating enzyme required for sulfatase activity
MDALPMSLRYEYEITKQARWQGPLIVVLALFTLFSAGSAWAQKRSETLKKKPADTFPPKDDHSKFIEPKMVFVKGGSFVMGDDKREEAEEKPAHKVNLSSFWISKYEVTVAEFRKFIESNSYVTDADQEGGSYTFDGKNLISKQKGVNWESDVLGKKRVNQESHPVIHVSHRDAEAYCKWLSQQTGKTYRLLTEAEWEYAAKGGPLHEHFTYSGSNDIEKVGWYAWNSDLATHPVGTKAPNGLGIYDMSGNVWEWCSDWFGPYTAGEQTNPKGADTGAECVMRSGGWRFYSVRARCSARRGMPPEFNGSGPGFRLACTKWK